MAFCEELKQFGDPRRLDDELWTYKHSLNPWRLVDELRTLRDIPFWMQMEQGQAVEGKDCDARQPLISIVEDYHGGIFDKPLPCFGCGIGWFSFLLGFVFPLMWYYATILYFGNYYRKDPRERAGLAASAIAALVCSVVVLITIAALLF